MPSPYASVAIQLSPRLKRMLASMADVLAERATLSAPVVAPPSTPLDSPVCDATTPSPPQSANRQETLIAAALAPRRSRGAKGGGPPFRCNLQTRREAELLILRSEPRISGADIEAVCQIDRGAGVVAAIRQRRIRRVDRRGREEQSRIGRACGCIILVEAAGEAQIVAEIEAHMIERRCTDGDIRHVAVHDVLRRHI